MTSKQVEIVAEAFAASSLAQAGYDVFVQYGANQPDYDLVAVKDNKTLLVSVKGSRIGGWALALNYKEPTNTYQQSYRRMDGRPTGRCRFRLWSIHGDYTWRRSEDLCSYATRNCFQPENSTE